jgi:sulfide:quinone oxidoreductase
MMNERTWNNDTPTGPIDAACSWGGDFDVVVIGGGTAGIGITAGLLRRQPSLRIAIVEPSGMHYYQPAWTLVGGGAYDISKTGQPMASVIPPGSTWIQTAASGFDPNSNLIHLADGRSIGYRQLVVCPGLRLAWEQIEGLEDTLGKNGVTSNYRFDLSPYTWSLVKELKGGKALFTQPPMPIKCAGAPQKAMYLSCDHWLRQGLLDKVSVEFNTAAPVLFGVAAFVPPLMEYVKRYNADLAFSSNLVKVDGPNRIAHFDIRQGDGNVKRVAKPFDMLHVSPPQASPDFVRESPLADPAGWCEVVPPLTPRPPLPSGSRSSWLRKTSWLSGRVGKWQCSTMDMAPVRSRWRRVRSFLPSSGMAASCFRLSVSIQRFRASWPGCSR